MSGSFRTPSLAALALTALLAAAGSALSAQTPLQVGRTVRGTLAEGDTVRYTLEVRDSTFFLGQVDQISVGVAVRVVDAKGEQKGRFSGPGAGIARFSGRLADAGKYILEVIPDEGKSGDYALTLLRVEPVAKDPRRRVDQLLARYDGSGSPGAAVRVWRDGRVLYEKTVGMANLAYGIPFRPDTRTNIGSTSKQFTAFAVMLQAQRGLLSLDDDVRKHIPELPEFEHPITVRHIITHTSGLREFLNLLIMTGRRLDHGDWIDRSELVDIVKRQPKLQNVPGAEWNYNNTAFGLAALIVERTSGQPFHVFMRDNVFQPLGMTRTMVRPSPEAIVPDMSEGYTPGPDGFLQIGDLGGAVGAGGIYTTLADLEKWADNMMAPDPKVGTRAIFDEMTTPYVLNDGKPTRYGYGLSVDEQKGAKRVQHGGADVAHRSMLAIYPGIHAGVTAQSNHAGFASGIAFEIAEAFFPDAFKAEEKPAEGAAFDASAYDPQDFDAFVGRYSLDEAPSFILTFFREEATLYTQATGQSRVAIVPTSDSTFALQGVDASVVFLRDAERKVTGLTLRQNGEHHGTRLEDEGNAGKAWKPTAEDLSEYAGRFFSDEIETFYTFRVEEGSLLASQRRAGEHKLTPGEAKDTFTGADLTFTFERDRNGEVIGFYVANGRTRDVRFGRVR